MLLQKHALWLATYIAHDYVKNRNINKREALTRMAVKLFEENNTKDKFTINDMMFRKHISKLVQDINRLPNSSLNVDKSKQVSQKVDNLQPLTPEQVTPKNFQDDFPVTY